VYGDVRMLAAQVCEGRLAQPDAFDDLVGSNGALTRGKQLGPDSHNRQAFRGSNSLTKSGAPLAKGVVPHNGVQRCNLIY
jgi:hypothetical protein